MNFNSIANGRELNTMIKKETRRILESSRHVSITIQYKVSISRKRNEPSTVE